MTTEFFDEGPVQLFGEGLQEDATHYYRDSGGMRLIAEAPQFTDTIALSAESDHAARLVDEDFGSLRTESGIGLRDSQERVLAVAGEPSWRCAFGRYQILWYYEKPEHLDAPDGGIILRGNATAYALKEGKVVEIWLHIWTTETFG